MTERPYSIGLRVGGRVVINEIQDEIEQLVGEVKAHDIEHALDGFQDAFFLLAASGISSATFFGEVFEESKDATEEGRDPVCQEAVSNVVAVE